MVLGIAYYEGGCYYGMASGSELSIAIEDWDGRHGMDAWSCWDGNAWDSAFDVYSC